MTAAAPLTARPGTVPIPYRVVEREAETPDTTTIVLEPVRSALQPFAPGQFAMVYAFGVGDIPLSVSGIDGRRADAHRPHGRSGLRGTTRAAAWRRGRGSRPVRHRLGTPRRSGKRPARRGWRYRSGTAAPARTRRARRTGALRTAERSHRSAHTPRTALHRGRSRLAVGCPDLDHSGPRGPAVAGRGRRRHDPARPGGLQPRGVGRVRLRSRTDDSGRHAANWYTVASIRSRSGSHWNATCTVPPATADTASSAPSCSAVTAPSSAGPRPNPFSW